MRLITYASSRGPRLGALLEGAFVDLQDAARSAGKELPSDMRTFIGLGDAGLDVAEAVLPGARPAPLAPRSIVAPIPDLRKNVFAVGRNYQEHLVEGARARGTDVQVPQFVVFFSKATSSVIGHEGEIELDAAATKKLDYELELVVVIGRRGRDIPKERAYEHVYGYTIGNDVSARDAQKDHLQWFKGKSMDTFCPIGPCIVPRRHLGDAQDLRLTLRVNGETRQDSSTSQMIFDIPTIVHQLSLGLTLEPGDLIMTGTPSGVGLGMDPQRWLAPGDVIEAEIEGIGVLRNTVVRYRA